MVERGERRDLKRKLRLLDDDLALDGAESESGLHRESKPDLACQKDSAGFFDVYGHDVCPPAP
jgi:hypothetical protein